MTGYRRSRRIDFQSIIGANLYVLPELLRRCDPPSINRGINCLGSGP